jgi:hypothetical protein
MTSSERADGTAGDLERVIDLEQAGWRPGALCPACGHGNVHTIVRAGVLFRGSGSWELKKYWGCTKRSVRTATGCHPSAESESRLAVAR